MKLTCPHFLMFVAALAGTAAVGFGALGSHGLSGRLPEAMLATYDTASRYLMYHSLAMLIIAVAWIQHANIRGLGQSGWLLAGGIALFSGSLYVLSLTEIRWVVWLTPVGGAFLIIGWLRLAIVAVYMGCRAEFDGRNEKTP